MINLDQHQADVVRNYTDMLNNKDDYSFDDIRDQAVLVANFVSAQLLTMDFMENLEKETADAT